MMIIKLRTIYEKMTNREKVVLYVALGFVVLMFTDLLVLNPIMSELKLLDSKIKTQSQEIQRDMRILAFKESIVAEYQNYENFLDTGNRAQDEIIGALLRKLESLAAQNDIKITNVMPGEIENKPIYKIYRTTLEFEGSLRQTLIFMNLLEESDNLFQISRYSMTPKNRTGQVLTLNMDISRILISAEEMGDLIEDVSEAEIMNPAKELEPEFDEMDSESVDPDEMMDSGEFELI